MPVVSIRFSDHPLYERLKKTARRQRVSISTLAERLIDEGLRMDAHPLIEFRDYSTGRYPALVGGPQVVHVIDAMVGGDVPTGQRRTRAAELMNLSLAQVDAALAYYADYTDEIDADIAERLRQAEEMEAAWRRQRELLAT
ncbi:CopG family transcriptional regulator [Candidatus Poriferisodalis sp.]|uniref:CopG family transcriptional regulator n=1 Tax=Candidatus Poriferisodalis sp. TaxID=3101277 RepID=UPI003C6F4BDC